MPRFFKVIIALLLVGYPVFIYYGLNHNFSGEQLGIVLLLLFTLRSFFIQLKTGRDRLQQIFPVVMVVGLLLLTWLFNSAKYLLWYPVGLNVLFLMLFASSLISPPTIIESIARRMQTEMTQQVINYTRKVTIAWCIFFGLNALISAGTVLSDSIQLWTLYNGLISYCLALTLFGGEILVRKYIHKQHDVK